MGACVSFIVFCDASIIIFSLLCASPWIMYTQGLNSIKFIFRFLIQNIVRKEKSLFFVKNEKQDSFPLNVKMLGIKQFPLNLAITHKMLTI